MNTTCTVTFPVCSTSAVGWVFCFNDVRAHLAYREADRLGLTVGRDLSVVGVDNQPFIAAS